MSEVLYELGVDIDSNLSFTDGDLDIVSYDDNLVQGVKNRLKTRLDELSLFYEDYGSVLSSYIGWKSNKETISLIKTEIETVLKKEQRIQSFESIVEYNGEGNISIKLTLHPNSNASVDVNLVLNEFGVIEESEEE